MPNLPHLQRVQVALKVRRIGYYSAKMHMLKQGGNQYDVAWLLANTLIIQGS